MATSTKLKVLPRGHRIIETSHGNYIQKTKRRTKQYKTTKAHRDAIKRGLRRVYLPALTGGALALGLWEPIQKMSQGAGAYGARILMMNYTGFWIKPGESNFKFRRLFNGLIPLIAVTLLNRSGLLKPINQKLARARIPLRLN